MTLLIRIVLLALACAASPAHADTRLRLAAVLPLDVTNAGLDGAGQSVLEETLRGMAGERLAQRGITVLTSETTLRLLADNGVAASKACEASCALELARELKAEFFLSGTVAFSDGTYFAFVRLYESGTGRQLALARFEGPTVTALVRAFEKQAEAFFATAPLAQEAPRQVSPVEPPHDAAPARGALAIAVGAHLGLFDGLLFAPAPRLSVTYAFVRPAVCAISAGLSAARTREFQGGGSAGTMTFGIPVRLACGSTFTVAVEGEGAVSHGTLVFGASVAGGLRLPVAEGALSVLAKWQAYSAWSISGPGVDLVFDL